MRYTLVFVFILLLVSSFMSACADRGRPITGVALNAITSNDEFDGVKIERTDDEWRAILTPDEYHILREKGTEVPYTGTYDKHKEKGTYHCAACRLKLFDSVTKFDSGTGWPSFYQPINPKNVVEHSDMSYGMVRTEVVCARCGGHLGHVFDDGPEPTGLRYCVNSAALKFEKD